MGEAYVVWKQLTGPEPDNLAVIIGVITASRKEADACVTILQEMGKGGVDYWWEVVPILSLYNAFP